MTGAGWKNYVKLQLLQSVLGTFSSLQIPETGRGENQTQFWCGALVKDPG